MSPRKYTEARKASNLKWDTANLDRVSLAMAKGKREIIKAAAAAAGESMNQFINTAIDRRLAGTIPAGADASRLGSSNAQE